MPAKKSPANRALGHAIRLARKEQGYTQEAFALKAGVDRSYMGAIERGEFNVTIHTLLTIARGLDLSAAEIMERARL